MVKKCKCIPVLETTNRDEKNPELLFVDARPHVNRKPSPDDLWGIELKETHELIGQIEVFDVQNDRYGMVGYRVAPGLWNRGIGTEAMRCVVDFIFEQTSLDRLQGHADVCNIASSRVLKKSGFQLEGTIRHGKMVSQYCDYHIWGMIREDYEQR